MLERRWTFISEFIPCYAYGAIDLSFDVSTDSGSDKLVRVKGREMAGKEAAPTHAVLSDPEIEAAIPLLRSRLSEVENALVIINQGASDEALKNLQNRVNVTISRVFGASSIEYKTYACSHFDGWTMATLNMADTSYRSRLPFIRERLEAGRLAINSLIDTLDEDAALRKAVAAHSTIKAYQSLKLHKEIERAASKLYLDGHFANAVEASVKALNGLVRFRSGLDVDGSTLMQKAFGGDSPILKFNVLADTSDRDEQRGFMMMFSGAVAGLRNPRAHGFVQDDPERALEFVAFVSLLAKLLDEATL